jgi:predicted RNA-binding Zn-ribbon protein involved in translation (DUF1610 family)
MASSLDFPARGGSIRLMVEPPTPSGLGAEGARQNGPETRAVQRIMSQPLQLYSARKCPECGRDCVIVQSRAGGLVTRNCKDGHQAQPVRLSDLPRLKCANCKVDMIIDTIDKNYVYKCPTCGRTATVHSLVPPWQQNFDFQGFGGPDFEMH